MAKLRIANWNIEWMNRWFTADDNDAPKLKPSSEISGVCDIDSLAKRVANVIMNLKPDILTVQEGPSRISEMALFVKHFLDGRFQIVGPAGKGQQKLYALVNNDSRVVTSISRVNEELGFNFDDVWDVDIDADLVRDEYRFTRPPLVMKIQTKTNKTIRLLSLHTKSKYVHNGKEMWEDPARRQGFVVKALEARRRISAESMRVREYLDVCFDANIEAPIVVTGDLNDGPGLDYFERHYLTHNVTGLISGSPFQPRRMLRHAFVDLMPKEGNYTAIFDDFVDDVKDRKVLLDHIFVSADLFWDAAGQRTAYGQIEHDVFDAQIDEDAPSGSRQRLPSDHRPQSVRLEV